MDFFERVKLLVKARGTTIEAVAAVAGLTRSAYNSAKTNGRMLRADEALLIAQTLGVSVEYLLTGSVNSGWSPRPDLIPIIKTVEGLDDFGRHAVTVLARGLAEDRPAQAEPSIAADQPEQYTSRPPLLSNKTPPTQPEMLYDEETLKKERKQRAKRLAKKNKPPVVSIVVKKEKQKPNPEDQNTEDQQQGRA